LELSLDGAKGNMLQASGTLDINVYGFVSLYGDLAVSKSSQNVKLASDIAGTTVNEATDGITADVLTIGGNNLNAFAGVNGGYQKNTDGSYLLDDTGNVILTGEAIGLALSDVDFGLALVSTKAVVAKAATGTEPAIAAAPARSWTSLQATAGSVGFVGLGDDLTIKATGVSVAINQATAPKVGEAAYSVVDYSADKTELSVATGTGSGLELSLDGAKGNMLQASGFLQLDVYGFVQVSGNLAVSKTTETLTLSKKTGVATAETVKADVLTIGGSSIDVFAGVNGGTEDAVGLSLDNISFGLALMTSQTTPARKCGRR
jgi:hypothetical protein